jgi:hypothetical protein
MSQRIVLILAMVAAALLILANCNNGDRVAPEDATIDLAASPTTVVLVNGSGNSDIVATVSSVAGVPLPDQDVRFTNTAGTLVDSNGNPAANLPIRTDSYGNAHVILVTNKTTTVSGRSGKATGSITIDTVTGDFDHIFLSQDITSSGCISGSTFQVCGSGEQYCLVAQAVSSSGDPVPGVTLVFKVQNISSPNGSLNTHFNTKNGGVTGSDGTVLSSLVLPDCSQCGGGNSCSGEIVATLFAGGFPSNVLTFSTSVP